MISGRVSVLMPVLNEEEHVADAIASALAQRDVDVEVLVIDGRSRDRTRGVVRSLARREPRVRLLDNPKTNIPSALNVGLAHAQGEFIARIDAHATVSPDYLARGVAHLRAEPRLATVGGIRIGVSDRSSGRAIALALSSKFGVGDSINHYATTYQYTDHASFAVTRAEVARCVGGWDESILVSEDVDFDCRILAQDHLIAFDPDMHILWKVRRTPAELMRQYRRYGRGKAATVRKNGPSAMRLRYLAPPVMVLGSAGLLAVATRKPAALTGFAPYLGVIGYATAQAWAARPADQQVSLPDLPAAFFAMHVGWGVGFLEGVFLGRTPALASGSSATGGAVDPPDEPGDRGISVIDSWTLGRDQAGIDFGADADGRVPAERPSLYI